MGDKNPKIGIIDYAGTIKEGKFFAFVILKRWVMDDGIAAVSSEARQQIRKTTLTVMNIIAQNEAAVNALTVFYPADVPKNIKGGVCVMSNSQRSTKKTAAYKTITDAGGSRYRFYCDLSGALLCTTGRYPPGMPELAWEREGKKQFSFCHKCGRWVMEAMFNADALECVACAPWENTPEYCKFCGAKVSASDAVCPRCGKHLIYGGSFDE